MGHRTAPPPLQSAQELDLSICQFVFLFVFGTKLLHTLCCLYLAETFDLSILLHLTLCLRKEFLMQE